jgi:hypothetical protein
VADANPEDEVGDVERPEDRPVEAPDANPAIDLIRKRADSERHDAEKQDDEDPKPPRRLDERAQQIVGQLGGVVAHASARFR